MAAPKQKNAKLTGWPKDYANQFESFESFKKWYDPRYKNLKAEEVWKKCGGKLPEKK